MEGLILFATTVARCVIMSKLDIYLKGYGEMIDLQDKDYNDVVHKQLETIDTISETLKGFKEDSSFEIVSNIVNVNENGFDPCYNNVQYIWSIQYVECYLKAKFAIQRIHEAMFVDSYLFGCNIVRNDKKRKVLLTIISKEKILEILNKFMTMDYLQAKILGMGWIDNTIPAMWKEFADIYNLSMKIENDKLVITEK